MKLKKKVIFFSLLQLPLIFWFIQLLPKKALKLEHKTTVVSIYFPLDKSKHSEQEYNEWNRNMLESVDAPLVIFTAFRSKEFIKKTRENKTTMFYLYENVWHLLKELEIERGKNYTHSYLNEQWNKDEEKLIHNPNLYAVWNLKAYIMKRVVELNPFDSQFFIYTDTGAWRLGKLGEWPDQAFVRELVAYLDNRMLFGQVKEVEKGVFNPKRDIIEGTFFAGSSKALRIYAKAFYDLHDKWLDQGMFVGKDQSMINELVFREPQMRNQSVRITAWQLPMCTQFDQNQKFDEWFVYQRFFAKQLFYNCDYEERLAYLVT
jgi:hypothetical protein